MTLVDDIIHMLSLFNVVYNIYSIVNRVADFIETFGLALRQFEPATLKHTTAKLIGLVQQ